MMIGVAYAGLVIDAIAQHHHYAPLAVDHLHPSLVFNSHTPSSIFQHGAYP
jgi:hypothetical protein